MLSFSAFLLSFASATCASCSAAAAWAASRPELNDLQNFRPFNVRCLAILSLHKVWRWQGSLVDVQGPVIAYAFVWRCNMRTTWGSEYDWKFWIFAFLFVLKSKSAWCSPGFVGKSALANVFLALAPQRSRNVASQGETVKPSRPHPLFYPVSCNLYSRHFAMPA